MTPTPGLPSETPSPLGPENPLRFSVGVTSPLWFLFAGAAASGAAYWWMTRWARPVNLEAMKAAQVMAAPPPLLPVEAEVEPPVAEVEAAAMEPIPEVVLATEPAPEPEPILEAQPAFEAAPQLEPEPAPETEGLDAAPDAATFEVADVKVAPKPAKAAKAKSVRTPLPPEA